MPRYVETTVKLSREQAKSLRDAIESGRQIALTCKLHEDDTIEKGQTAAKIALTPLQLGRVGAGKAVKITPAQAKYMRGAGFLTDAAKVASAVGQKIADEFVPDSEAANTLSNILLETTDVVERGLTGKKQFDYDQASKNTKMAIDRAKAFLAKSSDAKRAEWRRNPFARNRSYEEYVAQMTDLASRKPLTAKQVKENRFARMRGDPTSQEIAAKLVDKGKKAIRSKNPELFDAAMSVKDTAKDFVFGKGMNGGQADDINQIVGAYLRKYFGDSEIQSGSGRQRRRVNQ